MNHYRCWLETAGPLFLSAEHAARAILTVLAEPGDHRLGRRLAQEPAVEVAADVMANPVGWASERAAKVLCDPTVPQTFHREGGRFVIPGDQEWPTRLQDLGARCPYGLWVKGGPGRLAELVDRPTVAIIGSRAATPDGMGIAAGLVGELIGSPWVTVAGGAYGIDKATHASSASGDHGRVPTIVVLPCGIDQVYPCSHRLLFEKVVDNGGLVVSDMGPARTPHRSTFLARNRIIAASTVTVVVEAAEHSGSMKAAGEVRKLDRPLLAVPGPITSPASAGTNQLIAEGHATAVRAVGDLLTMLSALAPDSPGPSARRR